MSSRSQGFISTSELIYAAKKGMTPAPVKGLNMDDGADVNIFNKQATTPQSGVRSNVSTAQNTPMTRGSSKPGSSYNSEHVSKDRSSRPITA